MRLRTAAVGAGAAIALVAATSPRLHVTIDLADATDVNPHRIEAAVALGASVAALVIRWSAQRVEPR